MPRVFGGPPPQGLTGGLALLSLLMSYLQYAMGGQDAFLGHYSAHAQVRRLLAWLCSVRLFQQVHAACLSTCCLCVCVCVG
jgi:hypothetical protein